MNEFWGHPPENELCVYSVVNEGLPDVLTSPVPIEDLRPEPKGTEAILPIKDDLNGRIEGFGSRFWNHVLDRCGPLREDLEQKGPLKGVLYSDRYIATPWALVLLQELMLELVREGQADSGTSLRVQTKDLRTDYRSARESRSIADSFMDEAERKAVFNQALETGRGRLRWMGSIDLDTGATPHFRELRLEWDDDTAWSLMLDQGMGYWRCRPSAEFPFNTTTAKQVARLNEIRKGSRVASQSIFPTYIYVTRTRAGGGTSQNQEG